MTDTKKAQKENYEKIKAIKLRMAAGEKVSFAERNIVKIYENRMKDKNKQ